MKVLKTYKLKLDGDFSNISSVSNSYLQAINWMSEIIYNKHKSSSIKDVKPDNPNKLSKEYYSVIREKFKLTSQLTQSLFRHLMGTYWSMKSNGNWELAIYKKPTIPVCWKRDFNVSNRNGLTIWRNKFSYKSKELPTGSWKDSKIKLIKEQWYLILTIELESKEQKIEGSIIGVDRGIKNILVATNLSTNKTLYIKGGKLNHKRKCIRQTKSKVASVGTQSAKRLLKRLSGKEKSVTQEMLHIASKELVTFAESQNAKTIVMEKLTHYRKNQKNQGRVLNRMKHSWPYAKAGFFIEYKALDKGMEVKYVNPRDTSRSCPKCGNVSKENRNGLMFCCVSCGYKDNSDRVGSINISMRSVLLRQAEEERASINRLKVTESNL